MMKKMLALLFISAPSLALADDARNLELDCGQWKVDAVVYPDYAYMEVTKVAPVEDETVAKDFMINNMVSFETDDYNEYFQAEKPEIVYSASLMGLENPIELGMFYDTAAKSVNGYKFYIGKFSYDCAAITPAAGAAAMPAGAGTGMTITKAGADKLKDCIDYVAKYSVITYDKSGKKAERITIMDEDGQRFVLDQRTAERITSNWKFDDAKKYTNSDGQLYSYEMDACFVMENMKKYIKNNKNK